MKPAESYTLIYYVLYTELECVWWDLVDKHRTYRYPPISSRNRAPQPVLLMMLRDPSTSSGS